ncbi:hypothetical protein BABINDRAFT_104198 [Babjeviella inositovora NRRL Y-12698]|uniref:F-box domain-containing protein n=1 Tax=Babjeviella inositovora NRRL Y-12698 TaxID=984486 RepID=A0A1E3QHV0_9ASCO|nr:uncharacterized protein BABINDRAFT_104198 [Babjeviella inositovora NRRL Y-12698]ODQ77271.1 hypothetical protein BABINDRAFT_104198 [Babjeviella inositovora NRRL Y-12698]
MDMRKIPLFCDALPSEVVEKIVFHLPLSTVAELMKSENASLALVARRCYYSNIKLQFDYPPDYERSHISDKFLSMNVSDFEALVNSDTFSQLHIKKLLINVYAHIENFTFLHEKVFAKVSLVVTNVILEFYADHEYHTVFSWDWLPSSPPVQECIREISILYSYIDSDMPPLPPNLCKFNLLYGRQNYCDDNASAPKIVFPPSLQKFVSEIPWRSISAYAKLPSTF